MQVGLSMGYRDRNFSYYPLMHSKYLYSKLILLYWASQVVLVIKNLPTNAVQWTVACQAPLSIGFSRQKYWSGLPCPTPGDLPDPGIKPLFLMPPALTGRLFTTSVTWEAPYSRAVTLK